jgi:hypothetical protein
VKKQEKKLRKGPALRVQIAKDVIAQLNAKRFTAAPGVYLHSRSLSEACDANPQAAANRENIGKCSVCALGAVFVAVAERHNHISVRDAIFGSSNMLVDYIDNRVGFGRGQMRLMECAFERCTLGSGAVTRKDAIAAVAFASKAIAASRAVRQSDAEKIMRAIMRNVIANNGTFKP